MEPQAPAGKDGRRIFGLSPNVVWMGVVSFLNDLSSDMIFPFIPIFLTSVLGASLTFVGLVEGVADATASILKIGSGWISDKWQRRKKLVVIGYSLSALAKPFLAAAMVPWHVLGVRFMDRVGKGARDAPRDALLSFSTERHMLGRAFGFHRAMDTLGAALGPLAAFAVLPFIGGNYRMLFLLSFVASFFAVLVLICFVREVRAGDSQGGETVSISIGRPIDIDSQSQPQDGRVHLDRRLVADIVARPAGQPSPPESRGRLAMLGVPFFLFLGVATLASLGKASEAFLILKAREVGIALALLPILYFAFNTSHAILSTPLGALADRVGKRNTYIVGLIVFAAVYTGFAFGATPQSIWFLFIAYGLYASLTEGVGRAIVAGFVAPQVRATAFGIYNAATGLALLPASVVFGYLSQNVGSQVAFSYGAALALVGAFGFVVLRQKFTP